MVTCLSIFDCQRHPHPSFSSSFSPSSILIILSLHLLLFLSSSLRAHKFRTGSVWDRLFLEINHRWPCKSTNQRLLLSFGTYTYASTDILVLVVVRCPPPSSNHETQASSSRTLTNGVLVRWRSRSRHLWHHVGFEID